MNIYNTKYLSKKSCVDVEINVTLRKNAQSYLKNKISIALERVGLKNVTRDKSKSLSTRMRQIKHEMLIYFAM